MLQNRLFFCSGVEIRLWSYNFRRLCAYFYCVLQLSLCRSYCNGCVKVASCCGCICNTIVFCSWISEIVLEWLHEGYEINLLADFLYFGTNVVFVARRFRAVWSVGRKECSVKCEVWRNQWEVRSVKCGVWSVKCEVSVWSVKSAVWSVKFQFGVWRKQCEVWSVKCGVWSLKFGVRRVQCEVWSVKTLLRLSLKKSNGCRGKDTVGTGCLWTIGHLCLGNFRRRLARVYVTLYVIPRPTCKHPVWLLSNHTNYCNKLITHTTSMYGAR